MKVLVCGSRDWTNKAAILRELKKLPPGTIIVHGACPTGADHIADQLARKMGFEVRSYPADWDGQGKSAGPIRNSKVIREEHPDRNGVPITKGLAFTLDLERSRGTRDMVRKARAAGVGVDVLAV